MLNIWLLVHDDVKQAINECLITPQVLPPADDVCSVDSVTRGIFQTVQDLAVVQQLYKGADVVGETYYLYSLYFPGDDPADLDVAMVHLNDTYPGQIMVGGAWSMDGSQVIGYSPHSNLIDYMPDVNNFPDPSTPAVTVTDVNLLAGQQPRDFS